MEKKPPRGQTARSKPKGKGHGELRVGPRSYALLEKLSAERERYKAFDRHAGPKGDFRIIQILPFSERGLSYVQVLKRVASGNDNAPTILDYGVVDGRIVLVLPWIPGPSLRDYMNAGRFGISVFEAFRLFKGLSHGVSQLSYRKNIVHGDIKPENLVVCREPKLHLVMIDFGSAWTVERTATRRPEDGETDRYAAPELRRGERFVDFRSDQFSVFAVFYEMLTGGRPYGGYGGMAADDGYEHCRDLVPPSKTCHDRTKLMDSVWAKIDAATSQGLSLDRDRRFQGRREWLKAVKDIDYEFERTSRLEGSNLALAKFVERADRAWTTASSWLRRLTGRSDGAAK